jgi:hypothetical protein
MVLWISYTQSNSTQHSYRPHTMTYFSRAPRGSNSHRVPLKEQILQYCSPTSQFNVVLKVFQPHNTSQPNGTLENAFSDMFQCNLVCQEHSHSIS